MYYDVLEEIDKEAAVDGTPRNQLINQACKYYCKQLDEERREAAYGQARGCTPSENQRGWVRAELTAGRYEQLEFIARVLRCDVDNAAELLLERAVMDFDGRPFAYL